VKIGEMRGTLSLTLTTPTQNVLTVVVPEVVAEKNADNGCPHRQGYFAGV
jgi:hypothetical protein